MIKTDDLGMQSDISEIMLITHDDVLDPDVLTAADILVRNLRNSIPHIDSVKHASKVLDALLQEQPRIISCIYQLDDLHFSEMRSSVLRAGIIALALQNGHHAIIAPASTRLPAAHWRSEFIFRAARGIRLIRPDFSEQQVVFLLTQAIHFYAQHSAEDQLITGENWHKVSHHQAREQAA